MLCSSVHIQIEFKTIHLLLMSHECKKHLVKFFYFKKFGIGIFSSTYTLLDPPFVSIYGRHENNCFSENGWKVLHNYSFRGALIWPILCEREKDWFNNSKSKRQSAKPVYKVLLSKFKPDAWSFLPSKV